ncbi:MAG: hypothetical protein P4L84_27530 [Isosphaeraceae bacterium]|nr:hypothetical protein [Isosphaeraceae bacterium]
MPGALPSETEIGSLPRWARVALAARCGRRLQQILAAAPGVTREHLRVIDRAVGAAEVSAAYGIVCHDARDAALAADRLHERFQYCETMALPIVSAVACCVSKAAQYPDGVSTAAAYEAAVAAAKFGGMAGQVRGDVQELRRLALDEEWTDDTPVSPEVFGAPDLQGDRLGVGVGEFPREPRSESESQAQG